MWFKRNKTLLLKKGNLCHDAAQSCFNPCTYITHMVYVNCVFLSITNGH